VVSLALIRDESGRIKDDDSGKIKGMAIKRETAIDHKEIYVTWGESLRFSPYGMKISFFDTIIAEDDDNQRCEKWLKKITLIMPFATVKEVTTWLQEEIEAIEKEFGRPIYVGRKDTPIESSQLLSSQGDP
jgi:hypothetical protein